MGSADPGRNTAEKTVGRITAARTMEEPTRSTMTRRRITVGVRHRITVGTHRRITVGVLRQMMIGAHPPVAGQEIPLFFRSSEWAGCSFRNSGRARCSFRNSETKHFPRFPGLRREKIRKWRLPQLRRSEADRTENAGRIATRNRKMRQRPKTRKAEKCRRSRVMRIPAYMAPPLQYIRQEPQAIRRCPARIRQH